MVAKNLYRSLRGKSEDQNIKDLTSENSVQESKCFEF